MVRDRAVVIYNARGERTPALIAAELGAQPSRLVHALVDTRAESPGAALYRAPDAAEVRRASSRGENRRGMLRAALGDL